jgi:hypothetical protein
MYNPWADKIRNAIELYEMLPECEDAGSYENAHKLISMSIDLMDMAFLDYSPPRIGGYVFNTTVLLDIVGKSLSDAAEGKEYKREDDAIEDINQKMEILKLMIDPFMKG